MINLSIIYAYISLRELKTFINNYSLCKLRCKP